MENERYLSQIPGMGMTNMMPINENNMAAMPKPDMNEYNAVSGAQREHMKRLAAADFVALELQLFLDTHPDDREAMSKYNQAVKKAKALMEEYERRYGPLTAAAATGDVPWKWIKSPWTWE